MLNLNKCTKTNKLKPTLISNNCSYVCVYHCVQLYTTQAVQKSSDNFPAYPPDEQHSSDDVYWRGAVVAVAGLSAVQ